MERLLSPWVLGLLAALACYSRANTEACGAFGFTCFNETHFEMCVQEASGIMLRSGELQACPTGLMCVTNSLSICSDVLTDQTEGTTETEPYRTTALEDGPTLETTQTTEPTEEEEEEEVIGNGEAKQNIAKDVHDMNYHQQQQQQNQQEEQQKQQQEEEKLQQSPSEQMDLAQAIEPFNIQQVEIPELVQFEEPDLGFVPQFPLTYHFQPGISSASGFLKQKFAHNSESKLVHIEPSKYVGSSTSFDVGNFTCPGAGLFPAPPSCTEYHLCIHIGPIERHYIRSCWKGFEFSPRWRVCLPRILSDCPKNVSRSAKLSSDDDSQSQESDESDESNESDSSDSR